MTRRPNILLITSDQQHWRTLGVNNPQVRTPNLDRLCREGTNFTRAYCNNPVCSPSRSTIITGMYPSWHGCWTIGVKLGEDVPTIGDALRSAGYDTALIGKAHFQPLASRPGQASLESQPALRDLDFWRNFHGPWYGFEHVEVARMHADESHVGQHYAIWMEERGLENWRDYFQPWPPRSDAGSGGKYWEAGRQFSWELPEEFHYTTWTGERAVARIEADVKAGRPFFVWASFHDPHPPYLVPEPWASMYDPAEVEVPNGFPGEMDRMPPHFGKTQEAQPDFSAYRESGFANHGFHSHLTDEATLRKQIAVYYGMISFMDAQIGRILDKLDELGIADNTLVVFTTDHGHFFGQHGLVAKGPFHYEDLLKLPFVVRWPGKVPAGRTCDALQGLVDLAPTFLAAAGIEIPGAMQGVNQLPVWCGQKSLARDHVIVENRHQPTAVHLRTYVDERYKLTVYRGQTYGELFDLREDPGELANRWDDPDYAAVKAEVIRRFLDAELQREPTRFARIAVA